MELIFPVCQNTYLVGLYTKKCKIKFKTLFIINVGVLDLSKKKLFAKNCIFEKFKRLIIDFYVNLSNFVIYTMIIEFSIYFVFAPKKRVYFVSGHYTIHKHIKQLFYV